LDGVLDARSMLAAEAAGVVLPDEQATASTPAAKIPKYFMFSFCSVHSPRCARHSITTIRELAQSEQ